MGAQAAFTPGPWRISEDAFKRDLSTLRIVFGLGDVRLALVYDELEQDKANAALIAAAPDLYEALRILLLSSKPTDECEAMPGTPADLAERALAKARGGAK